MTPDAPGRVDFCPVTGKVCHRHRSDALAAVRKWRRRVKASGRRVAEEGRLVVYFCRPCSSYHAGNNGVEHRDAAAKRLAASRTRRERIEAERLREAEEC